jgi:hypothetical protein
MTLIEALPKNNSDFVEIPLAFATDEGSHPGLTTIDYIQSIFPDYASKTVPLTADDYSSLLEISTENWKINWEAFRQQGVI